MIADKKQLGRFLVKAKKATYAAGDKAVKVREADQSTSMYYEDGEWKYHDNFFGGEPFGGREAVFFKGAPVFIMTYYGKVDTSVSDFKDVYHFLQKALSEIADGKPFRGPEILEEGDYRYVNHTQGDIEHFFGEEIISRSGKEVYRANYIGGLVDLKKE